MMRARTRIWKIIGGVVLGVFLGGVLFAFKAEQRPSLEERMNAMEKDLREMKEMLKEIMANTSSNASQFSPSKTPSSEVVVSLDDDPVKGDPGVRLILVEFTDYQCPFCGKFFRTTLPEIEREYIQKGKLRYVIRDFPLPFHVYAAKAAEAAHCAGDQGKFWEMHDTLFEHQQALSIDKLKAYADDLKLDRNAFDSCLDTGKFKEKISRNFSDGRKVGVAGTPSFLLGVTMNGKTIKGSIITGTKPFSFFKDLIESKLSQPAFK
jgi:protein-disulfide isomerase